jgi:hypothetical protein
VDLVFGIRPCRLGPGGVSVRGEAGARKTGNREESREGPVMAVSAGHAGTEEHREGPPGLCAIERYHL